MIKKIFSILSALFLWLSISISAQEFIPLDGIWRFSLDSENAGLSGNWQNMQLKGNIRLPGTTDEASYGEKTSGSDFGILTRAYKHYGPAWYQRDIDIPAQWKDKRVFLEMERVMWESKVFVDGKVISSCDALNSPHLHDLGFLAPGKHSLTVRINNDMIHNIGDKGHAYTEYTQSIWNGAVGRIQLLARNQIRFSKPQVSTHIQPCSLQVTDTIMNELGKKMVDVCFELTDPDNGMMVYTHTEKRSLMKGKNVLSFSATMPQHMKLWDDVTPHLYRMKVTITERGKTVDWAEMEIGFREIGTTASKITINGKPVFLRGNLDCVHFPLTGYPSCKVSDWERIFRIYKDYGLNHVRFHSWCPPEAAFIAADRVGIFIQAEAVWIDWWMTNPPADRPDMVTKGYPAGLGKNPSADTFIQKELAHMVANYGNHPSFAMMCIGNELGNSDFDVMQQWLEPYKANDPRRLYSVSSARRITPLDQYMVTHYIDGRGATRGINGGARTDWDFEEVYSKVDIPVIAHEIGQWPVYPAWDEIKKYTGVLKARNLEEFHHQAGKNRIEAQNEDFVVASGALNQIMYKYEIESFLRTPSCAGIQLLSMQDYQGQGEALIGWLDVFYDSKGITTPERFRCHHDTTVTLLRMPKFIWESTETFEAGIQLAHYGRTDLADGLYWTVKDSRSNIIAQGTVAPTTYPAGSSLSAGKISCSLASVGKASKLTVEVGLQSSPVKNHWNIWVYPPADTTKTNPGKVYVTDRFDEVCRKHLENGSSVLLQASALGKEAGYDAISFYPLYWSLTFFPGQGKNSIGLLVDDKHPLFSRFPTDMHSDWQWQHIYKDARAFFINDVPESYKPMVQPVDDFHRNNKLGAIFEWKAGKGKLLVCGFDISDDNNPVARQLKESMLHYMNSADFNPVYEKDLTSLEKMFSRTEPVTSGIPKEFGNALLYVECGVNLSEKEQSKPWNLTFDRSEMRKNTNYAVHCDGVWKDGQGIAWHGKKITLDIDCPQGFIGSLYVFFHDWNNLGREGAIRFEGRDYALGRHQDGLWVKLHVMREDSNDGKLQLEVKANKGPNLMISKVVLLEE